MHVTVCYYNAHKTLQAKASRVSPNKRGSRFISIWFLQIAGAKLFEAMRIMSEQRSNQFYSPYFCPHIKGSYELLNNCVCIKTTLKT